MGGQGVKVSPSVRAGGRCRLANWKKHTVMAALELMPWNLLGHRQVVPPSVNVRKPLVFLGQKIRFWAETRRIPVRYADSISV